MKKTSETDKKYERIVLAFEPETFERIRLLAFQHRTSFVAVVRACVEAGFDQVKKDLEKDLEKA